MAAIEEPWLVYFLIFVSVFALAQFAYYFATRDMKSRRHMNRRLADLESGTYKPDAVILVRAGSRRGFLPLESFNKLVVQSGVKQSNARWFMIFVGLAAGSLLVGWWASESLAIGLSAAPFAAAAILFVSLKVLRRRRMARFGEQLPDLLDVIVRSLRAGHPLMTALGLAAREMPDPAGSELGLTSDEVVFGRGIAEALENFYERIGYEDLKFLVTAVTIQQQTGGNLGEILERLAMLLRERFKMRRKVRALSAEGRFSAVALSLFPFMLVGIMNFLTPSFYGSEWNNPVLMGAFGVCGVLLAIGNIVMYKMVNFKV